MSSWEKKYFFQKQGVPLFQRVTLNQIHTVHNIYSIRQCTGVHSLKTSL